MRCLLTVLLAGLMIAPGLVAEESSAPNIVWIISEDASPHIGCYGETVIDTPNLDGMAEEGIRFTRAFVTCPVCSPSRSAMVSGLFQTTLGAHNHRSQRIKGQGGGNPSSLDSYHLPDEVTLIPQLFRNAGYHVVNGGKAKTDYNFITRKDLYDGRDWSTRKGGQPFFAQIQLHGGKRRNATVVPMTDPKDVSLPPYYPDDPVLRADWARYLNSWVNTDQEVGKILERLDAEGIADQTAVFFWTDHGISHARGKQFCYDEGIHVPLIVRLPDRRMAGTVRRDLVSHIDIAAASLDLAGIEIPEPVQGRPLFAENHRPRRFVFAARDRCDETVDCIRAVRSGRFKYIRNFFSHLSHMQPNRYKDGKDIIQRMRELHQTGQLNELQARIFEPRRPPEELYDLQEDPMETVDVLKAGPDSRRAYHDTATAMRLELYQWMIDSGDLGLIAEPVLEELGRRRGTKFHVLTPPENARLMWTLFDTIEAGERRDTGALTRAADHTHPAVRWWAATGLGLSGDRSVAAILEELLSDEFGGVRVAAAQSLCLLGEIGSGLPVLIEDVKNEDLVVGMFAIRGLERIGPDARGALPTILDARQSPYDLTTRIADRLSLKLGGR